MLALAVAERELFVARGLADGLLEDLDLAVKQFEEATVEAHQGRREHVGASDDLKAVTDADVKVVGVLDGLVRYRFKSDPERLGQWKSARKVIGSFRSRKENPDETTPPGGGIAPSM